MNSSGDTRIDIRVSDKDTQLSDQNNASTPLLQVQPSYPRSKPLMYDELRTFRNSLKWCALDHSTSLGKFLSYSTFLLLSIIVPIISTISIKSSKHSVLFDFLVQFPESGLSAIAFFTLSRFFIKYTLRHLLFLDCLENDISFVKRILRFQALFKMFEGFESDPGLIYREHVRIKKQLSTTSHRYRFFIISCAFLISVSQLGALLLVLSSKSQKNFLNSGDLVVCSAVELSGFFLCLLGAAKITHRAQGISSIASRWHMIVTYASAGNNNINENPPESNDNSYESDSDLSEDVFIQSSEQDSSLFQTRQALVAYLEHNSGGITLFGYKLDRGLLHTLFAFEFSLVLWILSKPGKPMTCVSTRSVSIFMRTTTSHLFTYGSSRTCVSAAWNRSYDKYENFSLIPYNVQCYSSKRTTAGLKTRCCKIDVKIDKRPEKDAFFVVRKGDVVGIYKNLNDCQAQVGTSICDPPVSVFKGYSLPKTTEEYLVSRGLKNAVYTINASVLVEDLFRSLTPCPIQVSSSSVSPTSSDDATAKRSQDLLVEESSCSCTIEFDGASKGNPGPAGAGAIVRSPDGTVICRLREGLGTATCNAAEYRAIILGLRYALEKGFTNVRVQGDSKLIEGLWRVKSENLSDLYKEAKELTQKFVSFQISHVLRALNSDADAEANLGVELAGVLSLEERLSFTSNLVFRQPKLTLCCQILEPIIESIYVNMESELQ
ncbi:hypothetical protein ACFE04_003407 [Oxalis oulophora]